MAKSKMKCKRAPKSILKLPDLEQSKSAVLNSLTSTSSQRTYDHAIREFIEWYCSEPRLAFNKTVVTRYRISLEQQHYASTTINLRLAAVRRLAYEAADCGLLSADLAAGIRRVKGAKRLGMPVGNWLSAEQGKRLLRSIDVGSLRGKRDYATFAILLGCGLRRAELTALKVEDIQQREEHWVMADLIGKGGHIRTIPVPGWVKAGIDAWTAASGIAGGILLRSINKAGRVWGCGFSPKVIWGVVKEKAKVCEIPALAPHDLRRYAVSRIMPNRNLRPPEYWVILDRKGERIRHYRGPSNWRNLSLGRHRRLGDAQEGLESMIARMPSSVAGSVLV